LLCIKADAGQDPSSGGTGGTVRFYSSTSPINLCSATAISIMVYDTQGNNTVELRLQDKDGHESKAVWSDPEKSIHCQWTTITWSLSSFGSAGPCQVEGRDGAPPVDLEQIVAIELYEWNNGIYCFDDVRYR
jgi:hypothetical protein